MLARIRPGPVLGAGLLLCSTACAITRGPTDYLDKPDEAARHAHGGWAEVEGPGVRGVTGELIAVSADSLWVLAENQSPAGRPEAYELLGMSWSEVRKCTLVAYNSGASTVTGLTVLGTLTTASHGVFLVITAPIWVVTGFIASHKQRGSVIWEHPRDSLVRLRAFSRFPQGIPPGLDRSILRPRPRGG
jgi:hypothetical protein